MELSLLYIKYLLIGGALLFLIKWLLALIITVITLKLNYQKIASTPMAIGRSIKIVIIPSIVYVVLEIFLMVLLSIGVKIFLTGDARMFFSGFNSSIAFITSVMVFYLLIKRALNKNNIEASISKQIADNAVKYYVLIIILIGVGSMIL